MEMEDRGEGVGLRFGLAWFSLVHDQSRRVALLEGTDFEEWGGLGGMMLKFVGLSWLISPYFGLCRSMARRPYRYTRKPLLWFGLKWF